MKRVPSDLTADERREMDAVREQIEAEKPELVAEGRAIANQLIELGNMLRDARVAAGLSLADMADRTGMDNANLFRLENGRRNPTVDMLRRYAAALGMEVEIRLVEAPATVESAS